jgi:hypothetical protein
MSLIEKDIEAETKERVSRKARTTTSSYSYPHRSPTPNLAKTAASMSKMSSITPAPQQAPTRKKTRKRDASSGK